MKGMTSIFDPEEQSRDLNRKTAAAFERLASLSRALFWERGKNVGLSPLQIQILVFLRYHSENLGRVGHLADELQMTRPTVSDAVKTLEEKRMLRRMKDTQDARSHTLRLTAKGRRATDRLESDEFGEEIAQAVASLGNQDRQALYGGLFNVIEFLQQAGVLGRQRMCSTCRFFQEPQVGAYYCLLLEQSLAKSELRIDCAEHEFIVS